MNENEILVRRARGLGVLDGDMCPPDGRDGPEHPGLRPPVRRAPEFTRTPSSRSSTSTSRRARRAIALARYLLRVDEVKQSLRIIDQCLHQMPDGPVMARLPRLVRPAPGRAFAAVEGPRGMYAAYVISDGTDQPFRMRIHDPSFVHLQLVGLLTPGNLVADTMAIMASLDPVMGGVDK